MTSKGKSEVCDECGGKYRPAGGACTHEQTTEMWWLHEAARGTGVVKIVSAEASGRTTGYTCRCANCNTDWHPGHTCASVVGGGMMHKPHCAMCLKLIEDMTAEEIFNSLRVETSPYWGETKRVVCPACQDKEEPSE